MDNNQMPNGFDREDDHVVTFSVTDIRKRMDNLKDLWNRAGMFRAVKETDKLERGRHWMDDVD